jgi:hypothetical protein
MIPKERLEKMRFVSGLAIPLSLMMTTIGVTVSQFDGDKLQYFMAEQMTELDALLAAHGFEAPDQVLDLLPQIVGYYDEAGILLIYCAVGVALVSGILLGASAYLEAETAVDPGS